MADPKDKKVIVIADAVAPDGERARYSYWKHIFVAEGFEEYSVADESADWTVV